MDEKYASSRDFVKEMRALIAHRDLPSLQQAVEQMQAWMQEHPNDVYIGTALEEFEILEEAARLVEHRSQKQASTDAGQTVKSI